MKSDAEVLDKPKRRTEKPSKAELSQSGSGASSRSRAVPVQSETRASRRSRSVPVPSESRDSSGAKAEQQAVAIAPAAPVAGRAITMIESQPVINRVATVAHVIDVYALPNYATDRRKDPAARQLRGQLIGGSDLGLEIFARWGSGYYWLAERDAQNKYGDQFFTFVSPPQQIQTEATAGDEDFSEDDDSFIEEDDDLEAIERENIRLRVENARLQERARIRAEMPPPLAAPVGPTLKEQLDLLLTLDELRGRGKAEAPPPAPPKSLLEQAQELKQMEAIFTPKRENPPPPPPPVHEEPTDPRLAVLQMLMEDPDSAKAMTSKIRGLFSGETELPPEPQTSFWDFAVTAMESLAPILPALAQKLLGTSGTGTLEEPGQNAQPPAQPTPPAVQPRRMTFDEHFTEASQKVIDGLLSNAGQAEAAGALMAVINHNRAYGPTVIEMMKLSPEKVIEQLKPLWSAQPGMAEKLDAPHVIPWLSDVINRVRKAAGIEPGEAPEDETEST